MPKRNRHREMLKSRGPAAIKPAPLPAEKPAQTAPMAEAPKKPKRDPPWVTPPPLTPEARKEKERLKRQRHEAHLKAKVPSVLEILAGRWPLAFPRDPAQARPWAIGLFDDLVKQKLDFPNCLLRETLKRYTKTEGYQSALDAGGSRYDLDGNVKGEVTPEQMAQAAGRIRELREKKEQQKSAGEGAPGTTTSTGERDPSHG